MKRILAFLLLFSLLTPALLNALVLADYGMRYSYYAEVLCENKDKPELKCNGMCQLVQRLPAQNEPEEPPMPGLLEFHFFALCNGLNELPAQSAYSCFLKFPLFQYHPFSPVPVQVPTPPPEFC
ncbi:MAG TPA: hypothetical protein DIW47_00795 [Bacteroidetes bacterium]|nr:hypothetical protein [Bacteroidota bacterium]